MPNSDMVTGISKCGARSGWTKRITSDLIVWSADLQTQGMDRAAAYRQLRDNTEMARKFLIEQGVPAEDIRTSAVSSHQLVALTS